MNDRREIEDGSGELPKKYTLSVPESHTKRNLEMMTRAKASYEEAFNCPLRMTMMDAPLYFRLLIAWATTQSDRGIEEVLSSRPEFFCFDEVTVHLGNVDGQKAATLPWDAGVRAAVGQYLFEDSNPLKGLFDALSSALFKRQET